MVEFLLINIWRFILKVLEHGNVDSSLAKSLSTRLFCDYFEIKKLPTKQRLEALRDWERKAQFHVNQKMV